jgi:hypothetical protein
MSDWRSKVQLNRGDGVKAAAIILGLLVLCIFVVWLLARLVRHDAPPPQVRPPTPALPTPRPAQ